MDIVYDRDNSEIVIITKDDGSSVSMLKSTYDEMIAKQEAAEPLQ